jgi:Ca2+-binding EF-hand superfamily protein
MAYLLRFGRGLKWAPAVSVGLAGAGGLALQQRHFALCDEVGKKPKIARTLSKTSSSGRHDKTVLFQAYVNRFGAKGTEKTMTAEDAEGLFDEIGIKSAFLARRLFAGMDAKKSGQVTFKDMSTFCSAMATGSVQDKALVLFKMCDLDGEGEISKEAIRTMLKAMTQECVRMLPEFALIRNEREADLYAHLEIDDLCQMNANRITYDMFLSADTDKSGAIDQKEFLFWVKRGGKLFDEFVALFPIFDLLTQEAKK